jgi:hypothetical protein
MHIYCTTSVFMTDDKGIVEVLRSQREVAIDCKCQVSILSVCDAVPLGTWCLSMADN